MKTTLTICFGDNIRDNKGVFVSRINITLVLPIHRCMLALYTPYFPEFCENKSHGHITRVGPALTTFAFLESSVLPTIPPRLLVAEAN